jgi:hypothetical protein
MVCDLREAGGEGGKLTFLLWPLMLLIYVLYHIHDIKHENVVLFAPGMPASLFKHMHHWLYLKKYCVTRGYRIKVKTDYGGVFFFPLLSLYIVDFLLIG